MAVVVVGVEVGFGFGFGRIRLQDPAILPYAHVTISEWSAGVRRGGGDGMRWLRGARGMVLGPVLMTAVMCGDSPVPGACSGCHKPEPYDHGVVACTMQVDGTERPCRGEWYSWPNEPSYSLTLRTFDPTGAVSSWAVVDLDELGAAELADVTFESFSQGGGRLNAYAWVKGAGKYGSELSGGGVGTLHLSTRRPPAGTFSATLVPCVDPGHLTSLSGPSGTTVSVEVSFVSTTQ